MVPEVKIYTYLTNDQILCIAYN